MKFSYLIVLLILSHTAFAKITSPAEKLSQFIEIYRASNNLNCGDGVLPIEGDAAYEAQKVEYDNLGYKEFGVRSFNETARISLSNDFSVKKIEEKILNSKLILIGDRHTTYEIQNFTVDILKLISKNLNKNIYFVAEFIPGNFQGIVDEFLSTKMSSDDLKQKIDYLNGDFQGFDWTPYAEILNTAKINHIKVLASFAESNSVSWIEMNKREKYVYEKVSNVLLNDKQSQVVMMHGYSHMTGIDSSGVRLYNLFPKQSIRLMSSIDTVSLLFFKNNRYLPTNFYTKLNSFLPETYYYQTISFVPWMSDGILQTQMDYFQQNHGEPQSNKAQIDQLLSDNKKTTLDLFRSLESRDFKTSQTLFAQYKVQTIEFLDLIKAEYENKVSSSNACLNSVSKLKSKLLKM